MILNVIDTIEVKQQDVHDSQGRMYSLTIRPYKNVDNRIDGAVLALFDIDDIRRHEAQAEDAREYAEAVFNSVREPLIVLDVELRVRQVNPAFTSMFYVPRNEVQGKLLYELPGGQWNVPKLRRLLEEIVPGNTHFEHFEIDYQLDGGGAKKLKLSGRRIMGSDKRPSLVLLAVEPVG